MAQLFIKRPFFSLVILFLVALLLQPNKSKAQIKVGFGPKAGPNVSVFRGNFPAKGMRLPHYGFSAGGYLMVKSQRQKKWQFEANVLYTIRGNNSDFFNIVDGDPNNDEDKSKFNYNLGYFEVPLLFKYMLNKGGMTRPYLFFGPVYSGLLHAKFTNSINSKEENAFEWISRDDFGLTIGWGITSFFLDRWYHVDIRLFNGFFDLSDNLANDLFKFNSSIYQERASFYNTTLSVTLGIGLERSETFFLR